jgi:formate dehydrogenase major subunit
MTNHWIDLANSDCILIMGSNAAENHPISFRWITKAQENGGIVINVDPRFTRTSSKSDIYAALRSGTDIAVLGGMIKYILDNNKYFKDYVVNYTNAGFIVGEKYDFKDGLFSGYDAQKRSYNNAAWAYEMDENGVPKRDYSLENPRCVFQLLKKHYDRYDPEKVSAISGTPKDDLLNVMRPTAPPGFPTRPAPLCMPWAGRSIAWACRISAPCPSSSCFSAIWGLRAAG